MSGHESAALAVVAEAIQRRTSSPVEAEFDRFSRPSVPSVRVVAGQVRHDASAGTLTATSVKVVEYRHAGQPETLRDALGGLSTHSLQGLVGSYRSGQVVSVVFKPATVLPSSMIGGVEATAFSIESVSVLPPEPVITEVDLRSVGGALVRRAAQYSATRPVQARIIGEVEQDGKGRYTALVSVQPVEGGPTNPVEARQIATAAYSSLEGVTMPYVGRITLAEVRPASGIVGEPDDDVIRVERRVAARLEVRLTVEHGAVETAIAASAGASLGRPPIARS